MEDVVSYVTAIIILQGAAWSSAKAPWHGRPRWPVKVPNHSKGVPQSQPTSLAPPAVQYHPIWDRYATVPTHHHRNFAICWTVREEASKNEKKKKKEKRSELRAGRRCSRRDSGEKKAHTLPHSISLRTPHKQTLPRAHGSKVVLWLSQGPRGPGTGLGLANPNPTAFTYFIFIFQIRLCGEGGLGCFEILLNTILPPPPRFEREGIKEGAVPLGPN